MRRRRSIACSSCSDYIFIFDLTPGSNELGKDNCEKNLGFGMTCVLYYSFDGIIPKTSDLQIISIHSIKLDLTKAIVWNLFS